MPVLLLRHPFSAGDEPAQKPEEPAAQSQQQAAPAKPEAGRMRARGRGREGRSRPERDNGITEQIAAGRTLDSEYVPLINAIGTAFHGQLHRSSGALRLSYWSAIHCAICLAAHSDVCA